MQFIWRIYLLAFVFLILAGCKKEKEEELTWPAPKLKYLHFGWVGGGNHQEAQVEFRYDTKNRVMQMVAYYGAYGSMVASGDSIFRTDFFYDGNQIRPSSILHQEYGAAQWETKHFLSYDGEGRLARDSFFYVPNPSYNREVVYFSHGENYMIAKSGGFRDTSLMKDGNFVYSHSNLSDEHRKVDYDDKPNPLNELNIASVFHVVAPGLSPVRPLWNYWLPCNRNNSVRHYFSNTPDFQIAHENLVYTYHENGLPDTRRSYGPVITGAPSDTLVYKYF